MSHRAFLSTSTLVAGIFLTAVPAAPATAQTASNLRDLVGARAAGAESDLEARGYTFITGHEGNRNNKFNFWWNGRGRNCVRVETRDGRINSLVDTTGADCNQRENTRNDANAAAAVVGVALLAAALSHKSSHHDNQTHTSDTSGEVQFDRGYNDGLHGVPYNNYDRSDQYADGYDAGVSQRDTNTRHHTGRGGYASARRVDDLNGTDSIRAIDVMTERGFRNVDSITSGETQYGIFYSDATRQCVQMTMADGIVQDARDIDTHPRCR